MILGWILSKGILKMNGYEVRFDDTQCQADQGN